MENRDLKKETILLYQNYLSPNTELVDDIYNKLINVKSHYSFSFFSIRFARDCILFEYKTISAKNNKRLSVVVENYGSISKNEIKEFLFSNIIFVNSKYIKDAEEFKNYFKLKIKNSDFSFADYFVSYEEFYNYFSKYMLLKEF